MDAMHLGMLDTATRVERYINEHLFAPDGLEEAVAVAGQFKRVPEDFTVYLTEDYDRLPEESFTRLQARLVGGGMVGWYRNYWRLRKALQGPAATSAAGKA